MDSILSLKPVSKVLSAAISQNKMIQEPWNILSNPASDIETVSMGNLHMEVSLSKLKSSFILVHLSTIPTCLIPVISPMLSSLLSCISLSGTSYRPFTPLQHGIIRLNSMPNLKDISESGTEFLTKYAISSLLSSTNISFSTTAAWPFTFPSLLKINLAPSYPCTLPLAPCPFLSYGLLKKSPSSSYLDILKASSVSSLLRKWSIRDVLLYLSKNIYLSRFSSFDMDRSCILFVSPESFWPWTLTLW